MRTMLIAALTVAIATTALCCWGVSYIDEATDELSDLAIELMHFAEAEDYEGAQDTITTMASQWAKRRPILEILTDHENLHTVTEHLVEGEVHLKHRNSNDFYRSMALLDEALRHIRDAEKLSPENLL